MYGRVIASCFRSLALDVAESSATIVPLAGMLIINGFARRARGACTKVDRAMENRGARMGRWRKNARGVGLMINLMLFMDFVLGARRGWLGWDIAA
jgi:hypothetical protein